MLFVLLSASAYNYSDMGGKLVIKRRKDLMADLGKKDYTDIVMMAVTKMQNGLQLD